MIVGWQLASNASTSSAPHPRSAPGGASDNAIAEAWVATFKSELVDGRRFPSVEHAEHEVLHWIRFYNGKRLHEALGDLPPSEYKELNIKRDNSPVVAATQQSLQRPQGGSITNVVLVLVQSSRRGERSQVRRVARPTSGGGD